MRSILACVVLGALLSIGLPRQGLGQGNGPEVEAAEFAHLLSGLTQSRDFAEQITLAEQALKLEPRLQDWPFPFGRRLVRSTISATLGLAYAQWAGGDRTENMERAIEAFRRALADDSEQTEVWAERQSNLGNAYLDRVQGDRADNIEQAIAAYENALRVRTREGMPKKWAFTQHYLGQAYWMRIRGDTAENQEKAIAAYEGALTVLTRATMPHDWAGIQHDLGYVYWVRVRGERADNLEKAIAAYEGALTVRTREGFPRDWASTQHALGIAYGDRIRGSRPDSLEKAIAAYEAALTVRTREAIPYDWANTQNSLGVAYQNRVRGDRVDNLEKAIAAHEAALTVIPDWAAALNNLGDAYSLRKRGYRADNMEKAIALFEKALTIFTQESGPLNWAYTQSKIGAAYGERIQGDRSENLEKAVAAFKAALTVRTREDQPFFHFMTAVLLGPTLLKLQRWTEASSVYASAREAFLVLFGQGLNEAEARDLIAHAGPLFAEAAFAATQLGEREKAFALATEGRARLMAVALKLRTLGLSEDKRRRLDELRAEIRGADSAMEKVRGTERAAAVGRVAGLRQELLGLLKDADASAGHRRGSALTQARALAGKDGVVVVPVVTRLGGKILIVSGSDPVGLSPRHDGKGVAANGPTGDGGTKGSDSEGLTAIDFADLTSDKLNTLMRGESNGGGWLGAYSINYFDRDELNRRWPEWIGAVGGVGPELWKLVGRKLDAELKNVGANPGSRIVWMPTGALGILPLGVAQDPTSGRYLADSYEIVYAPSLEALTAAREWLNKDAPAASLGLIVNPTGDLPGTEKESKVVASHFPAATRAVKERGEATPAAVLAALKGKSYWHFATHGTFSWDDARKSGLYMSGPEVLTVGKLLETDGLGRPRLVVLSACETGLYDINSNPDEFIGLPGTFTALGAAGVLGTLWPVNDAATALLISKFYELHLGEKLAPPTALRQAQVWLRQATNAELQAYAHGATRQGRLEARYLSELEVELSEDGLKRSRNAMAIQWLVPAGAERAIPGKPTPRAKRLARPYAHPYFWAGFIYTGL